MSAISRDVKRNIKYKMQQHGSLHTPGTRGWFLEDFSRCLHPKYKSFADVQKALLKQPGEKVHGVYIRHEKGQNVRVKLGKGIVEYVKRKGIVDITRAHTSATERPLNNDEFFPCITEEAAKVLEAALQRSFGSQSLSNFSTAIKDKVQIHDHFWLRPEVSNSGDKGGREVFDFSSCFINRVSVITNRLRKLTSIQTIGRTTPNNRYYQLNAKSLLANFCINGGSERDFYLLMKPRSGKNITCILGLVDVAQEYYKETGRPLRVLLLSLWPSAFAGLGNDVRDYAFDCDVGFVNTQNNPTWEQDLEQAELLNQLVFVTASLQSLDADLAKKLKDNPNLLDQLELEVESYDPGKHEKLRNIGFPIAVFDECDHGLRTDNSKAVIESFNFTKCIWMSGSDLYALRNEAVVGVNAYVYDFIQEINDVKTGKIEQRPLPVFLTFRPDILPFEDIISSDEMNVEGVSRRLRVVQQTTVDVKCEKSNNKKVATKLRSYTFNNDGFAVDSDGDVIRAVNHQEMRKLLETALSYDNAIGSTDYVSPNDLIANNRPANIFAMACSVAGQLAIFNEIKLMNCGWVPVSTKEFTGSTNIERDINDRINELNYQGHRTITVTTRQLLRGAKANWDGVVRFDDLSDFKIGLQAVLRGQNTTNDKFYVWDMNLFRCSKMNVEIKRAGTTGNNLNTKIRETNDLLPVFAKGTGIRAVRINDDELIALWQKSDGISEGLSQDNNYDEAGVIGGRELLEYVGTHRPTEDKRDERAGKTHKPKEDPAPSKKSITVLPKSAELRELKAKAKTVGRQLSVLLYLMVHQGRVYDEIDPLLNNCPDDLFNEWLSHVGIYSTLPKKEIKKQLGELFVKERINHQLQMLRARFESGNFSPKNWNELTQLEKSDVFTDEEKVRSMYSKYGKDFWNTLPSVFDPGCGRGEFLVVWVEKLLEHGCSKEELSNRVFWADLSPINIRLVAARLNIAISNGFVYNASIQRGTERSFNEGLTNMSFDINKVHVVGNLPFTSGTGKAPVAIPIMTNLLSVGTPLSINLVQHTGFMPSRDSNHTSFRKSLYDAGLKEITMNPVDLFEDSDAKVRTADLFCVKGYQSNITITSLDSTTYNYDYRAKDIIVDGGSKELTEFLYELLDAVNKYGCLLNRNTSSAKGSNPKAKELDVVAVDVPAVGYAPYLSKMTVNGNVIKYAPAHLFKWTADIDSYRSVHGYRPSGLEYGDMRIGLTTIIEPGINLPAHPNLYFKGTKTLEHATSLNNYIHSGPIERFVLPITRENKTFDAKTEDGVTKFIPMLPEGIQIENDNDVFNFLGTPDHIRKAVRANYRY